jgi:threonine/homoserine/homoserine lactone efflux protein
MHQSRYVWWVTVGATYILLSQTFSWSGVLVFFLGHITGDYLWNGILSGVVGGGRKWFTETIYKWIIAGCGLYLIYLGLTFLISPFR